MSSGKGELIMYALGRKWFDRARDIAEDFEYKDYFWCNLLVLLIGILFGVSANKTLKYLTPFIAIFAAFAALLKTFSFFCSNRDIDNIEFLPTNILLIFFMVLYTNSDYNINRLKF